MEVSIIIVNYRVKYFLEQTILSAKEALVGFQGEIIVIDNDSCDDSIHFLRERFPDVVFIENKENIGFARANNIGINESTGKFVLILNPDTIITKDTISDCMNWMKNHDDCGAIGVKMLDGNGSFLPESKRSFPTPWVSFCKIFGLSKLFPYSQHFAKYHLLYLSTDEPHKVDILSGAFMFVRSEVLKKVKGFDSDFFMYGEDIDLSYRMIKEGYNNYFLPTSIIHYKGESTKKDSMKYVQVFYDAMLIFYKKHYPHYSYAYGIFIRAGILIRALIAAQKRFFLKLVCPLKAGISEPTKWCIVSDNSREIEQAIELGTNDSISTINLENLNDYISLHNDLDVIFDNRDYSYKEIVRMIEKNSQNGVRFHIFSGQNGMIISPKSNVL